MRALITGITGQDGLYLAELLWAKGYEVHGLVRDSSGGRADFVRRLVPGVALHVGDVTDLADLERVVRVSDPAEVYNLAAASHVALSWQQARRTTDVTAVGVLNLLEALRSCAAPDVRLYQASSSEMFGKGTTVPQSEQTLLWPRSPYGVAKVFGHHMTVNYRESYGMHASCGVLFNHESPRRGAAFVTRKISLGVARIALGMQEDLVLGDLSAQRDWGFAGEYVEAMWLMLQQPDPGDYVIATGVSNSVEDFVRLAFAEVGITDWRSYVRRDPELRRPAEVGLLIGDPTRAQEVLGWTAQVRLPALVSMMVRADLVAESAVSD